MSRILITAAFAVAFGVATPILADGFPAAITPPLPKAPHALPEIPRDVDLELTQFKAPSVPETAPPAPVAEIVARQSNISNFGAACGPSLALTPAIDAMLAVKVYAPCLPYDTIRLEHEGLSFTVPMPMTGELTLLLPALAESAIVKAHLSDGTVLRAEAEVPDADEFARVALQWNGLNPGELVAKAPKVLDGAIIHLGQSIDADGAVLHVFSSRVDQKVPGGVVRLSMRAPVTLENCETGHSAHVHRSIPGEPVADYDLKLKGPGCDAIGESLELKNVLQDLKL